MGEDDDDYYDDEQRDEKLVCIRYSVHGNILIRAKRFSLLIADFLEFQKIRAKRFSLQEIHLFSRKELELAS